MDCDITGYHVESFNFFCNDGLRMALDDVPTEKFRLKNGDAVEICYKGGLIRKPNLQSAMVRGLSCLCYCFRLKTLKTSPTFKLCTHQNAVNEVSLTEVLCLWILK